MKCSINYRVLSVYILSLIIGPFLIIYLSNMGTPMTNEFSSNPIVMGIAIALVIFAVLMYFSRLAPFAVCFDGNKVLFYALPALRLEKDNIKRMVIRETGIRFETKRPVKGFIMDKKGMYAVNITDIGILKQVVEFAKSVPLEFNINWKFLSGKRKEMMEELVEKTGENKHESQQ